MKKTCCVLLAASLMLALCGCGNAAVNTMNPEMAETSPTSTTPPDGDPGEATCKGSYTGEVDAKAVVATVGEKTLTAGELQAWYWAQVAQSRQEENGVSPDFASPLDAQSCELDDSVSSWQQYFLKQAMNAWHSSTALALQGEAEGLPTEEAYQPNREYYEEYMAGMPAAKFLYGYSESYQPNTMHQEYLDNIPAMLEKLAREKGYADASAMAKAAFGTTKQALAAFVESHNYGYMYFTSLSYYIEPTEEEFEAYFTENRNAYTASGSYVDIRHILLTPEDAAQEDDWLACEQEAQSLLNTWQKGLKVTEATFADLANKNSDDTGSALNGGLYRQLQQGQLIAELDSWCFDSSRQVGDTAILRSQYGVHILYFCGSTDIAYAQAKEAMLTEMQAELLAAAREAYPMEADYSAIALTTAEGTVSAGDLLYPDIAHERFPEVPLYLQQDYPKTRYGEYKITTNGCGITSLAMLASYMTDEEWTPPELCALYGRYSHSNGTDGMIFINEAPVLGFYFKEKTHDVFKAKQYLEEGYIVISLQHAGYWTSGGHYIVLEDITEDGMIQVRDSNLYNYRKIKAHKEDLHTWNSIRNNGSGYWVFEYKVKTIPACSRCGSPESAAENLLRMDYTCEKCDDALLRRTTYLEFYG